MTTISQTLSNLSFLFGVLLYAQAIEAISLGTNPALAFGLGNIAVGLGLLRFVDFGNRK
jgi:hypothetical protein